MMAPADRQPRPDDRRHVHYARNLRMFKRATAEAAHRVSQSQIAKEEGISRQRVHQIIRRLQARAEARGNATVPSE